MKTLLGFVVLVLYTFSMLAWGTGDAAKLCRAVAPPAQHATLRCPEPVAAPEASAAVAK